MNESIAEDSNLLSCNSHENVIDDDSHDGLLKKLTSFKNENAKLERTNEVLNVRLQDLQLDYNNLKNTSDTNAKELKYLRKENVSLRLIKVKYNEYLRSVVEPGNTIVTEFINNLSSLKETIHKWHENIIDLQSENKLLIEKQRKYEQEVINLKTYLNLLNQSEIIANESFDCNTDNIDRMELLNTDDGNATQEYGLSKVKEIANKIKCINEIEHFCQISGIDNLTDDNKMVEFSPETLKNTKATFPFITYYFKTSHDIIQYYVTENKDLKTQFNEGDILASKLIRNFTGNDKTVMNDIFEKLVNLNKDLFKNYEQLKFKCYSEGNRLPKIEQLFYNLQYNFQNLQSHVKKFDELYSCFICSEECIINKYCSHLELPVNLKREYCNAYNAIECSLKSIEDSFKNVKLKRECTDTNQFDLFYILFESNSDMKVLKKYLESIKYTMVTMEEQIQSLQCDDITSVMVLCKNINEKLEKCNKEIVNLESENKDLQEALLKLKLSKEENCELDSYSRIEDELTNSNICKIVQFCNLFPIKNGTLKEVLQQLTNGYKKKELEIIESLCEIKDLCKGMCNSENSGFVEEYVKVNESNIKVQEHEIDEKIHQLQSCMSELNLLKEQFSQFKSVTHCKMRNICYLVQELKFGFGTISALVNINYSDRNFDNLRSKIQFAIKNTVENMAVNSGNQNEDLLNDMFEMNLELKKRGEIISHLNQNVEENVKNTNLLKQRLNELEECSSFYKNKIANFENEIETEKEVSDALNEEIKNMEKDQQNKMDSLLSKIKQLENSIDDLQEQNKQKDVLIIDLQQEILRVKETQDGDTSSMETLSRTDESMRLCDVEDSFEERYIKLRSLALKMKQKMTEMNQHIETQRSSFSSEKANLESKLSQLMPKVKLSQLLQEECDKLNDTLELKDTEIKGLKKIISDEDNQITSLNFKISEMLAELNELKTSQADWMFERDSSKSTIMSLKSDLEAIVKVKGGEEMIKHESDKEIQEVKQKLKESEENFSKMRNKLEQAKLEARKQGALNLEMRDYEKTISDLTKQLTTEKEAAKQMDEKINECYKSNFNLIERIKQLEKDVITYKTVNESMNEEIIASNKKTTNYNVLLEERELSLQDANKRYISEKTKVEDAEKKIVQLNSEVAMLHRKIVDVQETLTKEISVLHAELNSCRKDLQNTKLELTRLNDEFEAYKIRAHSVLQKHKNEYTVKHNENLLKQNLETLEHTILELRQQLDLSQNELEDRKMDLQLLEAEKQKLYKTYRNLTDTLLEKEHKLQQMSLEFKQYKLTTETRNNSYLAEIESLKSYKQNADSFKKQIEELTAAKVELSLKAKCKNEPSEFLPQSVLYHNTTSPVIAGNTTKEYYDTISAFYSHTNTSTSQRKISDTSVSLMDSFSANGKSFLLPLEELLSGNNSEIDESGVMKLKEQLTLYERQIHHLNVMLNEVENNSVRNEHQVSVLKDEIRRLQRVVEREPHIKNTEYLKNVMLKFLTLQSGEERSVLVPVLETMLKLSPEECRQLSAIAKDHATEGWSGWNNLLAWK